MTFLRKHKLSIAIILSFGLGFLIAPNGISVEEYNSVKSKYETTQEELKTAKSEITSLESKVKEA